MKSKEALAYCRQLLFEERIVHAYVGAQRVCLAMALQRWRDLPCEALSTAAWVDAERQRWRDEVAVERASSLERSRRDAHQLERTQARLDAAEGVVAQLRADNETLRMELTEAQRQVERGGDAEQVRSERSRRAAAGARALLQESALRARLEAEQSRLADSSAQLATLEALADEDAAAVRLRQSAEEQVARDVRDAAVSRLRTIRTAPAAASASVSGWARLAWRAAYAHVCLRLVWLRHERELEELEGKIGLMHALRESREGLDWRVTQTKAQCATPDAPLFLPGPSTPLRHP